jgi:hypothetical protein
LIGVLICQTGDISFEFEIDMSITTLILQEVQRQSLLNMVGSFAGLSTIAIFYCCYISSLLLILLCLRTTAGPAARALISSLKPLFVKKISNYVKQIN